MKRGRDLVKTRNKSNGDAFVQTNKTVDFENSDDEEQQESEEEVRRNKVIRLRHSYIANDKAERGQKRQKANSNSDESPVRNGRKRIAKTNGAPRKSEVNFDASAYFSSDVENADTDNENRENRDTGKGKRFRRRLSKKLRDEGRTSTGALNISYGNLNATVNSPNSNSPTRTPTDTKTLREIYSTCSALFQAHKITPQNAFSLKLVECIDEIIQSEDFDKQNLPLLARTLEIGGKIYVCRVDYSHTHTVKLASEIASNQKSKDDNEEDGHGEGAAADAIGEEGEDEQDKTKKKTRTRTKKKSRYIENDDSKLNTKFEDQSSKYVTRRTSLKSKLHRNIDEELEFDYLSFFVKPGEVHPLERDEVSTGLDCPARIPPSHVNEIDMKQLNFLPFNLVGNWSSSKYDIWGQPLDNSEPLDTSVPPSQPETQPEVVDEFAYNPETRPDEYPDPIDNGLQDDFQGGDFDMPHDGDDGNFINGTARPLTLDSLRSLKDLHQYFSSLKGVQLNMKQKYGWAGPIFLKPQRMELKKRPDGKVKKGRKPKQEMVLDYDEVDWKDPSNRYVEGTASKLILDDKMLSKWSETKTSMPYCSSHNFLDYDEDEEEYNDPFETEDCAEADIFNVVRFFVDTNRNIFKLMEEEFKEGKDVLSQSMMREQNTSDRSMEIEAPRDYMDDSVGHDQDQGEAGPLLDPPQFQDPYASLLTMLPASAGFGLDTDDPLSKVSEIDTIKFSKQPKPIDMHELKKVILDVLTMKLQLNEDGRTTSPDDTSTDLLTLICETLKRVSQRMLKHMTISIVVVGLMHVVADKRLFMTPGNHEGNPQIICRGSNFIHKDHIPMGRVAFDF